MVRTAPARRAGRPWLPAAAAVLAAVLAAGTAAADTALPDGLPTAGTAAEADVIPSDSDETDAPPTRGPVGALRPSVPEEAPTQEAEAQEVEAAQDPPAGPDAPAPPDDGPSPEEQALAALVEQAEAGDREAQYRLGLRYEAGDGVAIDMTAAAGWYARAAEAEHTEAMFRLSGLMLHGQGMAPDRDGALDMLRAAAALDHRKSQFTLGLLLLQGDRVPVNPQEAEKWLVEAAMAGHGEAATLIGNVYLNGDGLPADPRLAIVFLGIGAEAGVAEARLQLARLYREGIGVTADQRRAMELVERAASQGSAVAMGQLMLLYADLPFRHRSGELAYIMAARALWTEAYRPIDLPAQPLPPDTLEIAREIVSRAGLLVPGLVRRRSDEIIAEWGDLLMRAWDGALGPDDGDMIDGLHGPQPIIVTFPDGTLGLAVNEDGTLATGHGPVPPRFTPEEMGALGMEMLIPRGALLPRPQD